MVLSQDLVQVKMRIPYKKKTWYNVGTALKEDLIMAKHYDKQVKLDAVQYLSLIHI